MIDRPALPRALSPRLAARTTRRLRWLARRARANRRALAIALSVFVAVNLVLLAGYLWSRGGQTTHVRIEARGDQFAAYADGQLRAAGQFNAPAEGGLIVSLESTTQPPSLPKPRGIDSVRVTALDGEEVLFEDDFSDGPSEKWTSVSGAFLPDNGVLGVSGSGTLQLTEKGWRDYAVDVRFKNITSGSVMVRAQGASDGVVYTFRPFRHYDNLLALLDGGQAVSSVPGDVFQASRIETIKSMVEMTLRTYPMALLLLATGFLIVLGLLMVPWPRSLPVDEFFPRNMAWVTAGAIAVSAFVITLYLNYSYGSHMPHVPDEVSYIFQAKLLASGHLSASPPPVADSFDFFYPPLIIVSDGHWASVYPFAHPLLLAIGWRLGAMWLVPPLVGAGSVLLIFGLGRRIYNARAALLAALLLATSPFFLMTASNFMSHNTGAFYLLLSLLFVSLMDKRRLWHAVAAGICFGLLFNTRPLTAMALVPPFGAFLLVRLALDRGRREGYQQIAGFVAGGLLLLFAYWGYNQGSTGDAFRSGYQVAGDLGQAVGFGGRHTVNAGIQNEQTQLTFLLLVFNGWPAYIGLSFVLLPFILGTRKLWDWFLLVSAVFVMGAYTLFEGNGIMHGPRYWYEATPFLMLLTARGADRAAELLGDGARAAQRALFGLRSPEAVGRWLGVGVVYSIVLVLVGAALAGWLFGRQEGWVADFVPDRAVALKGFNGADDRLLTLVDDADLDNALVLVEPCPHWQCYGTVFWRNSPDLDGNVVYARNLDESRADVLRLYPDRAVYEGTYTTPGLTPYEGERPSEDEQPPPNATSTPEQEPTQVTTPTVNPLAAVQRDEQRRRDLFTLAAALQQYYDENGSYPATEGVQSFCLYPFDAACDVQAVLSPLPKDPSEGGTYWYQSDGDTFIVYAALEGPAEESQCPVPLPEHFAGIQNLYCIRGSPSPDSG